MLLVKKCFVRFKLEWERRKLHRLIKANHMCDEVVVRKSKEVDELVLQHMKLVCDDKSIC